MRSWKNLRDLYLKVGGAEAGRDRCDPCQVALPAGDAPVVASPGYRRDRLARHFSSLVRRSAPATVALAFGLLLSCITAAHAQDAADEFGEKPAAKSKERPLPVSNDPAVRALLETNPATPPELLGTIDTLLDLKANDVAYSLVKRLAKAKLDEQALAELVDKFGSALFIRLALVDDLQPEGREVSDAALAAADRRARDPRRLAKLIDQLKDRSSAARRGTMTLLLGGREAAIQALAAALIDPARAGYRPAIRAALVKFGRFAQPALAAMVRSAEPAIQVEAIGALAELAQSTSAMDLLAPALVASYPNEVRQAAREALVALIDRVPEPDETIATLLAKARAEFAESSYKPDPGISPVVEWHWDADKSALSYDYVPPYVVRADRAADLAGDAVKLDPRKREAVWISFAARAEAEAYRVGIDKPAPTGAGTANALLKEEDVDVVEGLLGFALDKGRTVAATAAARALGEIGNAELLYRFEPQPSSIVRAARDGDRRLRFAALEAIMRLNPRRPYPGSSLVVDALGFFAGSLDLPRAMVADARSAEVERQSGLLAELGYEVESATSERDVVAETIASPDFLVAMIDYNLAAPTSAQLLQRLRRDNRTARLPIGIIASTEDLERARRLAGATPLTAVIYRPVDAASLDRQLKPLLAAAGQRVVPPEERRQQARQAVAWLAQIAAGGQEIYNLRRIERRLASAVRVPDFGVAAARVLGTLGTASSQKTLVDVASEQVQPIETRQAADRAFANSVARFGTLLTTSEINLQYDRQNQSREQDPDMQKVLNSILDTIEARAAADRVE